MDYWRPYCKIKERIWKHKNFYVIIADTLPIAVMDALTKPAIIVQNVPVCIAKQKMLTLTNNEFNPNGYWDNPVEKLVYLPTVEDVALFDQNGYDLTDLEKHYAYSNWTKPKRHREHREALKQEWFTQEHAIEGAVLNHSLLFERKGYAGAALEELQHWAKTLPLIQKVIALRPKWGLDFSMDYVDRGGNAFEVLHWEWDSFNYEEIEAVRKEIEPVLLAIDWQDAGQKILAQKVSWHHLDFFAQSEWKCKYFGIPNERFKMVAWA